MALRSLFYLLSGGLGNDSLYIHCLMLLPFGVGVLCGVLVLCVLPFVLSSLAIILLRKKELVVVLKLCCSCLCFLSLPRCTMVWSAGCDCGSPWVYSLDFYSIYMYTIMSNKEIDQII